MSKTASTNGASEMMAGRARAPRGTPTDDALSITRGTSQRAGSGLSAEERRRLVAEAAYFRALQRGFAGGSPEDDWFAAEAEVDARFAQRDGAQAERS